MTKEEIHAMVAEIQRGKNVNTNLLTLREELHNTIARVAYWCPDRQFAADIMRDGMWWIYTAALKFDPAKGDFRMYLHVMLHWTVMKRIDAAHERKTRYDKTGKRIGEKRRLRRFVEVLPEHGIDYGDNGGGFNHDAAECAIARLASEDRMLVEAVLRHGVYRDAAKQLGSSKSVVFRRLTAIRPVLARYYREELDGTNIKRRRFMAEIKAILKNHKPNL